MLRCPKGYIRGSKSQLSTKFIYLKRWFQHVYHGQILFKEPKVAAAARRDRYLQPTQMFSSISDSKSYDVYNKFQGLINIKLVNFIV